MDVPKEKAQQAKGSDRPALGPLDVGRTGVRDLVSHLEDLVTYALECEKKPIRDDVSFTDVYKRLVEIRKSVDILSKEQQDFINAVAAVIGAESGGDLPISAQDKQLIEKIQSLQRVCESAKERLYTSLQQNPDADREIKNKIRDSTSSEKRKVARRKGKFRSMGEGWIPA